MIFAIGIRGGLLASVASIGMRRRVVWSVPDLLPPGILRPLVRLVAAYRTERLLCLSQFIAADLTGRCRRLRDRAVVVHPGVALSMYRPDRASPGKPRAAIVGHISLVKRTDLAVETTARVLRDEPGFELEIIGSPQFRDENVTLERRLRNRVESDPSLREAVHFRGRLDDVTKMLAGCGLLLHFRDDEPFGMAMVEAMAHGLPVVAPAAGGALEIVEEGSTGLLFRPGDVDHAAECVIRLCRNPEFARSMGRAGRQRVQDLFTVERQVELTRSLLQPSPLSSTDSS